MERTYEYAGLHSCESRCGLTIHRRSDGLVVVVARELEDNPGTSVTNAAEVIATQVCRENAISPHRLVWVEHYAKRGSALNPMEPTWDRVTFDFDWEQAAFRWPVWSPLTGRAVAELLAPTT